MQSLDVISVNIWQILISLCNLVILFLLIKKILYKRVKIILQKRKDQLDGQYAEAENAKAKAFEMQESWQEKMTSADEEADSIIKNASETATARGDAIIAESKEKAERIIRQAKTEAELEHKRADAQIKKEIVEVSSAISEKILGREINIEDHRDLIDSFISEIGEDDGEEQSGIRLGSVRPCG